MATAIPYADEGWPIVTGCSHAHIGCQECYAARLAATRLKNLPQYKDLSRKVDGKYRWTGEMRLNDGILDKPLHWKKPRTVFVAQTSDLFHKNVPFEFIDKAFAVMAHRFTKQHTFLVFTKRPARMAEYCLGKRDIKIDDVMRGMVIGSSRSDFLPLTNVHLYTSISDQATADENIQDLLRCPAVVRGISYEPVLGPADLSDFLSSLISHVIVGCESGPDRRPCKLKWIESAVERCQAAGVPVYVKQINIGGKVVSDVSKFPKDLQLRETPKGT